MASGHGKAPHQQAGHMAAPTSRASPPKNPCQQGAVHTWHLADIQPALTNVRYWGDCVEKVWSLARQTPTVE